MGEISVKTPTQRCWMGWGVMVEDWDPKKQQQGKFARPVGHHRRKFNPQRQKSWLDIFLRYRSGACVLAAFTLGHLPP